MNQQPSFYNEMTNAEGMVYDFLCDELNLFIGYEIAVYLCDDKGRPRVWTPDFYLPDLGMYIEVVGDSENPNYSWREGIYKQNHIPIIFLHPYDHHDWKTYLVERMFQLHQSRWEILRKF